MDVTLFFHKCLSCIKQEQDCLAWTLQPRLAGVEMPLGNIGFTSHVSSVRSGLFSCFSAKKALITSVHFTNRSKAFPPLSQSHSPLEKLMKCTGQSSFCRWGTLEIFTSFILTLFYSSSTINNFLLLLPPLPPPTNKTLWYKNINL